MIRTIPWRAPVAGAALVTATAVLGLPDRPTLPVGQVTAPVITAFLIDGLRLLVTVSVWYLLLAVVLSMLDRLPGLGALTRPVAERVIAVGLATAMRRVLATPAPVGVSLPVATGAQGSDPADQIPVMVPVPDGEREARAQEPPVMTREDDGSAADRPQPTEVSATTASTGPGRPSRVTGTYTVRPGDSFWSIAEDIVGRDADPRSVDVGAVVPTWQRLVDANADNLVDPGNPDLLHVGQVIRLG